MPLAGTCNQCGLCCTTELDGRRLVCEHLEAYTIGGTVKPLGHPLASRCKVYEQRVDGMQIKMLDGKGIPRLIGPCGKGSWREDHAIILRGIGQGCSLTIPTTQGELVSFEPAKRS